MNRCGAERSGRRGQGAAGVGVAFAGLLTLLLLPRCKGVILGVLWATRAGDDRRDDG